MTATITEGGLKLLKQIDKPIQELGVVLVQSLSKAQMGQLVELLDLVRASAE